MNKFRVKVYGKAIVTGYIEVEATDAWHARELVLGEEVAPPSEWVISCLPDVQGVEVKSLDKR